MPQGKWEMNEDKKQRLIEFPEIHPALDSRVPQFSFIDGRTPQTPSKPFPIQTVHIKLDKEKLKLTRKRIVFSFVK